MILPSYAAVFSSSKPVKSPLAVSRTYQALLDLVQVLQLPFQKVTCAFVTRSQL